MLRPRSRATSACLLPYLAGPKISMMAIGWTNGASTFGEVAKVEAVARGARRGRPLRVLENGLHVVAAGWEVDGRRKRISLSAAGRGFF